MKKLLFICSILISATTFAQVFNPSNVPANTTGAGTRGTYGNYQAFNYATGTNCTIVTGTVTPVSRPDTLKSPVVVTTGYGTDSGYSQVQMNSRLATMFDFSVTRLTGTLAGAAVLQGSIDNATWYTLTGNTATCASCIGASATLSGTGTTHYTWMLAPDDQTFPYYQVRAITSGTCTATFALKAGYKY